MEYLEEELPFYIIIIAAVVVVIILLLFLLLCTVYRRNATKNERKVKHLLQERDKLELQVAMECKEGEGQKSLSGGAGREGLVCHEMGIEGSVMDTRDDSMIMSVIHGR